MITSHFPHQHTQYTLHTQTHTHKKKIHSDKSIYKKIRAILIIYTQQLSLLFVGLVGTCPLGFSLSNSTIVDPSISSKSAVEGERDIFPCLDDTSIIFLTKKFIASSERRRGGEEEEEGEGRKKGGERKHGIMKKKNWIQLCLTYVNIIFS